MIWWTVLRAIPLWLYPMGALLIWGGAARLELTHLKAAQVQQTLLETQAHENALETQRLADEERSRERDAVESHLGAATSTTAAVRTGVAQRLRVLAAAPKLPAAPNSASSAPRNNDTPAAILPEKTRSDLIDLAFDADGVRDKLGACQEFLRSKVK